MNKLRKAIRRGSNRVGTEISKFQIYSFTMRNSEHKEFDRKMASIRAIFKGRWIVNIR